MVELAPIHIAKNPPSSTNEEVSFRSNPPQTPSLHINISYKIIISWYKHKKTLTSVFASSSSPPNASDFATEFQTI
ncbi:hypothetical protein Hanom_Chr10g00955751 [Helianthus anomalus]